MKNNDLNLKNYIKENGMYNQSFMLHPLFSNNRKEKLTPSEINNILKKYLAKAKNIKPSIIPDNITCHSIRHSKAMHLLQSGVNLIYIRDILSHVSIHTTEIYVKTDSKHKRLAIEKAYTKLTPAEPL